MHHFTPIRAPLPAAASPRLHHHETLIAVAILLILLVAIMSPYVFSIWGFQSITNYVQLHQDGRVAVNQFLKDARAVYSVDSYASNGPFVVEVETNFVSGAPLTTTVTFTFSSTGHTFSRSDPTSTTQLATKCQ